MNKYFCIVALLLGSMHAYAQYFHPSENVETEVFVGLSLNNYVGSDIKDANMKMGGNVGITGRYFITENVFGELSLAFATKGYKQNNSSTSGRYWLDDDANYDSDLSTTMSTYNIEVPVCVGYSFPVAGEYKLNVKVGPYATYAVSGKRTTKGKTTYYPDIHSSETEYVNETKKIGDMDDFEKFGIGVNVGIGIGYENYVISATFQRGLTKLFDNGHDKVYEQNIMVTLGYKF